MMRPAPQQLVRVCPVCSSPALAEKDAQGTTVYHCGRCDYHGAAFPTINHAHARKAHAKHKRQVRERYAAAVRGRHAQAGDLSERYLSRLWMTIGSIMLAMIGILFAAAGDKAIGALLAVAGVLWLLLALRDRGKAPKGSGF